MTVSFRITDVMGLGADGFAFVIQNSGANVLGGTGGAMGYGSNIYFDGPTPRGIENSLAVEFDMWNNQNPAGRLGRPRFEPREHSVPRALGEQPLPGLLPGRGSGAHPHVRWRGCIRRGFCTRPA